MGYIYCIQNTVNNKLYIGQTTKTIEERFKMHLHDAISNKQCQNRPFYKDILKYGSEKFIISKLEEIDNNKLNNQEQYWIDKYKQENYKLYNITLGGQGKQLFDTNVIIELYNKGLNAKQISKKLGCCSHTVLHLIKSNNINVSKHRHIVLQYDLNSNLLNEFFGSGSAAQWLVCNNYSKTLKCRAHITDCCNNKKRQAYGFKWKYKDIKE